MKIMTLALTSLLAHLLWAQQKNFCKKPLLENYGIISYEEAQAEYLVACPATELSCCPAYE